MNAKKTVMLLSALLLINGALWSQTLDDLKLIAHYPLKASANDTLGNYDPVQLINTPFQDGGIYCNGNSYGNEADSSYLATPVIDSFTMDKFAVSARFKITTDYEKRRPIFVCGTSWRWLFVFITPELKIGFGHNDTFNYAYETDLVVTKDVWHSVTVTFDSADGLGKFYIDGALADTDSFTLTHGGDKTFSIQHDGTGMTFKGFLADLKFYARDETAAVKNTSPQPRAFTLRQNYPNPFNPTTTIEFSIEKPGDYELSLHDTNGRKVRTLLQDNLHTQTYSLTLAADNLPSGVYLCRLQGAGKSQVRRLVLLK